jgi:aldose 1-epimerase
MSSIAMPTGCGIFLTLAPRPAKGFVREDDAMTLEVVTLQAGALTSRWVPSLGMIGVSLFHGRRELLGQRGGLETYAARGSTFGIPLLHPWANRLGGFAYSALGIDVALDAADPHVHTEEHGLPIHGLLAAHPGWVVREAGAAALGADLDFTGADLLAAFPFPHRLSLDVALDDARLTVTTTLTPTTEQPVPITFGFHPYLTAPGAAREDLVLRTPAMTRLELDARGIPTGERSVQDARDAPLGDATYDDHFTDLGAEPAFTLTGGGRAITMRFLEGYTHLQLFAPAGQPFVAIEPMTAPTDALRSGDGLRAATADEPFRAAFAIEVRDSAA